MKNNNIWTSEQKPNAQCPYNRLDHLNLLRGTQDNQPNGHHKLSRLKLCPGPGRTKQNHPTAVYLYT